MELIIGRDASTSQLRITMGQQSKTFGGAGSVPMTVSRQHCSLTINPDGSYRITNLKPQNVTFINGVEIMAKTIMEKDKIELGPSKFLVSWDWIKSFVPQMVDFRPLQRVWEEYDEHKLDQQIADRKFNSLRGITGLITMGAIALSIIFPEFRETPLYIGLYLLGILISVGFTVKAYKDSSKGPLRQKQLTEEFQQHYVCPHCHHFLGFQSYEVLMQNEACPYCKAKVKKGFCTIEDKFCVMSTELTPIYLLFHYIIRKTKCFRILERNAKISKTKRNFSRLYPTPQKFKKIDRLRRNEIHLKAVRTSS